MDQIVRKDLKSAAKRNVKRHYILFVALCLLAAILGSEFSGSLDALSYMDPGARAASENTTVAGETTLSGLLRDMVEDSDALSRQLRERERAMAQREGVAALGHQRGILAAVVNKVSSGSYLVTALAALRSLTRSETMGVALLVLLSTALSFSLWFFVKNIYNAAARRLFLEGRVYDQVPGTRLLFFLRVKKWARVACTLFVTTVLHFLWSLTVVGGLIKRYSYFLVPYLVAENPALKPLEAITLSRRIMRGHKWECFVLELSFLGWGLLDILTLGASGVFFSNPYRVAVFCEYYAALRAGWLRVYPEDSAKLCDSWLFEAPDTDALGDVYADVWQAQEDMGEPPSLPGLRGLLAGTLGVLLKTGPAERAYENVRDERARLERQTLEGTGKSYPLRLSPIPTPEGRQAVEVLRYTRCYSIWSLLAMFFTFAIAGWVWEVAFAFLQSGEFVNRGLLHGPWLPIYGTGVGLILVVLYRFRARPALEFILAMALSGCVEYFTSLFMELAHGGQRWWDYSGYFLNLHGRICAEGLLMFGVAGCLAVYVLAPLLDNVFRRLSKRSLVPACLVLLLLFCVDQGYSAKHPNVGKGITDVSASAPVCVQNL